MPRPAFGALAKVWSEDFEAAERIRRYTPLVERKARVMERDYPGEDFEAAYTTGLYEAAFTFDKSKPGTGWDWWLHLWIRKRNNDLIYRFNRSLRLGRRISLESVDESFWSVARFK